tara:strand:+ start:260 stop:475 length:216 start_codon:yes stop_codon:yes gene_type:complete
MFLLNTIAYLKKSASPSGRNTYKIAKDVKLRNNLSTNSVLWGSSKCFCCRKKNLARPRPIKVLCCIEKKQK